MEFNDIAALIVGCIALIGLIVMFCVMYYCDSKRKTKHDLLLEKICSNVEFISNEIYRANNDLD